VKDTQFEDRDTRFIDRRAVLARAQDISRRGEASRPSYICGDPEEEDGPTVAFLRTIPAGSERVPSSSSARAPYGLAAETAAFLEVHARTEFASGRTYNARVFCERAMAIRREQYGEGDPNLATSFCTIGVLSFHLGDAERAAWHFNQARLLLERRGQVSSLSMGSIYNNLGVVARHRGDIEKAYEYYQAALSIKVEACGWEHRSIALSLANIGHIAELLGDLDGAYLQYARARTVAERTEGSGSALAAALLGLGRVHRCRGDHLTARVPLERALRIREKILCTPLQLASARVNLAHVLVTLDPEGARALVGRALAEYRAADAARGNVIQSMEAWLKDSEFEQAKSVRAGVKLRSTEARARRPSLPLHWVLPVALRHLRRHLARCRVRIHALITVRVGTHIDTQ